MKTSRLATWVLLLILVSGGVWAEQRPSLEHAPGLKQFQAYLGETFRAYGGRGARRVEQLTLTRIDDMSPSDHSAEHFRLVFLGSVDSTLQKEPYNLEHPEAGRFLLFLDPGPIQGDTKEIYADFHLLPQSGVK